MSFKQGHALIIGVGSYPHIHNAEVQIAVDDAKAVEHAIKDEKLCGYPTAQVESISDGSATRVGTLEALDRLAQRAGEEDTVFLFYVGHGALGTDGNFYLVSHDAKVKSAQYMRWDFRDMIRSLNLQGGGWAYYNYDAGKQRTRKRLENRGTVEERIYLGGYELYRKYDARGGVVEEIKSHPLLEGEQRLLLVEDVLRTSNARMPTGLLYRYQYSNHLGSACVELDDRVGIISYEEYHPYDTSAYLAVNSRVEVSPKRYSYTGKKRDEESGLYYHGARYYASWLGRWVSCDPVKSINLYIYARNSPLDRYDPDGRQDKNVQAVTFDPVEVRGDLPTTSKEVDQLANEYYNSSNMEAARYYRKKRETLAAAEVVQKTQQGIKEGGQIAAVVWAFMLIFIASGVTGGLTGGAALNFMAAGGTVTVGMKLTAAGFAGLVGGSVEVGLEQPLRLVLGERLLSEGDVLTRVALSTGLGVAGERLAAAGNNLLARFTKPREIMDVLTSEGSTFRSVGAAARETEDMTLEVVHLVKADKGLPSVKEMISELKAHRQAIQDILENEGLPGLQSRIREYIQNKRELEALRAQIYKSLGSAGTGRVHSHHPDMVLGADPLAIGGSTDALVNSIIGAASKQWAQQILEMSTSAEQAFRVVMKITLMK